MANNPLIPSSSSGSFNLGVVARPAFSWNPQSNTGIYQAGVGLGVSAKQKFVITRFYDPVNNVDFKLETGAYAEKGSYSFEGQKTDYDQYYIYGVKFSVKFLITSPSIMGHPFIISNEKESACGFLIAGVKKSEDPSMLMNVYTVVLRVANPLEFAEEVDRLKKLRKAP